MIGIGAMAVFYHSEKLQSTKTDYAKGVLDVAFYHSEKLQSTKTSSYLMPCYAWFYHSEKLQSTKTINDVQSVAG